MTARKRRLLFVDDDPAVLDGLRNVLRSERGRWDMRFATGAEEALSKLRLEAADVVVTDLRMPGLDGLGLLDEVRRGWPDAARIVLSGHADLPAVAKASSVAHQYLVKPCAAETVKHVVERAIAVQDLLGDDGLRRTVGALGSLPSAPRLYVELTEALGDSDVAVKRLVAIVEEDVGMSSRVLQFANSAYFGLPQQVTSIESAIVFLGVNTLVHLALTLEVFRQFGGPVADRAAFDALERHALLTARIARRLVGDEPLASSAFAAGLLHDSGKLVLMRRLPGPYAEAGDRAARLGIPMCQAETEILGANHAQVGAYLLGLWGLPHAIIEAVAFHHDEARQAAATLDTVAAVAAADFLANAVAGEGRKDVGGTDADQLGRLAMDRSAQWWSLALREAARIAAR